MGSPFDGMLRFSMNMKRSPGLNGSGGSHR
jgi:hypothetical protein